MSLGEFLQGEGVAMAWQPGEHLASLGEGICCHFPWPQTTVCECQTPQPAARPTPPSTQNLPSPILPLLPLEPHRELQVF